MHGLARAKHGKGQQRHCIAKTSKGNAWPGRAKALNSHDMQRLCTAERCTAQRGHRMDAYRMAMAEASIASQRQSEAKHGWAEAESGTAEHG